MKLNYTTNFCLSAVASFATGCSLFVPSHQTVNINVTTPQHAKVWINGAYEGETPIQKSVLRNRDLTIMVKKEGYQTTIKSVDHRLSPTGVLDVIGTGVFLAPALGFISPGAFCLDESSFVFQLAPEEAK
jgi:hypothetical protein